MHRKEMVWQIDRTRSRWSLYKARSRCHGTAAASLKVMRRPVKIRLLGAEKSIHGLGEIRSTRGRRPVCRSIGTAFQRRLADVHPGRRGMHVRVIRTQFPRREAAVNWQSMIESANGRFSRKNSLDSHLFVTNTTNGD